MRDRDLSQIAVASLQSGMTIQALAEFSATASWNGKRPQPLSPDELKEIRRLRGQARRDCLKAGIKVEKLIK